MVRVHGRQYLPVAMVVSLALGIMWLLSGTVLAAEPWETEGKATASVKGPTLADVGLSYPGESGTTNPPLSVTPGESFAGWYKVSNSASKPVDVMLGMSIALPDGTGASDPGNDKVCAVPANTSKWCIREFQVPQTTNIGTYEVRFAIWKTDWSQQYGRIVKSSWLKVFKPLQVTDLKVEPGTGDTSTVFKFNVSTNGGGVGPYKYQVRNRKPDNSYETICGPEATSSITWSCEKRLTAGSYKLYAWVNDSEGKGDGTDPPISLTVKKLFQKPQVGPLTVQVVKGEAEEVQITVTNPNDETITVLSFTVMDKGGFQGELEAVNLTAAGLQVAGGQSASLKIRVVAKAESPDGTYNITFKVGGN